MRETEKMETEWAEVQKAIYRVIRVEVNDLLWEKGELCQKCRIEKKCRIKKKDQVDILKNQLQNVHQK